MFEHQLAQQAQEQGACADFLELYTRFRQDALDPAADRLRMAKLEAKVDNAWRALPQDKREMIVAALLDKKMLPEEVGAALRIFNGKVISLI